MKCFVLTVLVCSLVCACDSENEMKTLEQSRKHLETGFDEEAFAAILELTNSRSDIVRVNACATLGIIARKYPSERQMQVAEVLGKALTDRSQSVRRTAAEATSSLNSSAILQIEARLVATLAEGNDVSWFAAEALGKAKQVSPETVKALVQVLEVQPPLGVQDEAPQIRVFAAKALGEIGPGAKHIAIQPLKSAMTNSNPFFALEAAKSVQKLDPDDAASWRVIVEFATSSRPSLKDDADDFLRSR